MSVINVLTTQNSYFKGSGFTPSKKKPSQAKITELKANPNAKEESLKLKEVQDKMHEANQFLSENSSM